MYLASPWLENPSFLIFPASFCCFKNLYESTSIYPASENGLMLCSK